jgi:hypothetical protein
MLRKPRDGRRLLFTQVDAFTGALVPRYDRLGTDHEMRKTLRQGDDCDMSERVFDEKQD